MRSDSISYARSLAVVALSLSLGAACTDDPPRDADRAARRDTGAASGSVSCTRSAEGEAGDLALARCLAKDELLPPPAGSEHPVVVYFDRSASMRGFLDPKYPTRIPTDYRSVIDRLVVGLRPTRGFSFGAALRPAEPTLATLGNRDFYVDRDTQTEQVLAEIGRDTANLETHMIVTDGRRGSPNAGDAQYVRLRELGVRWVERGGSFVVGASLAPFQTVASDPSGCRRSLSATADEPQTCPLYVFGFVAPGEEWRILTAVASVFERIYIWPAPTIPPAALTLVPNDPDRRDLRIERRWTTGSKGTPIVRVRGDSATNRTLSATILVRDTTSVEGRTQALLLRDQLLGLEVHSRGFTPAAAAQAWTPVEARGSLVRRADEPDSGSPESPDWRRTLDFVTRGPRAPLTMFMIEMVPTGTPIWIGEFAAKDASDVVRTYGLGRLFESFRADAARQGGGNGRARAMGRFFIVAG